MITNKSTGRKKLIQAVERALNILEVVRNSKEPVRAIDIARQVGLSSAAANNIVRTLYIRDYLSQDENRRYIIGGQSYLLGTGADAWNHLRSIACEPMLALSKKNSNLSFLGVASRGKIIAVEIVEGRGPVIIPEQQTWLEQFHCTAVGKILLTAMLPDEYSEFKSQYLLCKLTEKTISKWSVLEKQMDKIRYCGYSVCHDESVFGITSIAVPVRGNKGNIIAGLATAFSSYYLNDKYQNEMVSQLQNVATVISAEIKKNIRS